MRKKKGFLGGRTSVCVCVCVCVCVFIYASQFIAESVLHHRLQPWNRFE